MEPWYCIIAYPFIIAYCTCHVYSVALSSTCRCICVVPPSQPPFDGDDDDQLFNNIMEKPVHYPRGLADTSKKIIQGVRIKEIGAQDFENLSMWSSCVVNTMEPVCMTTFTVIYIRRYCWRPFTLAVLDEAPVASPWLPPRDGGEGHQRTRLLQGTRLGQARAKRAKTTLQTKNRKSLLLKITIDYVIYCCCGIY